ncbi:MAG: DNA-binding transcriptional LysR family regulator [Paraglaciecola sp.]|jgi:DNA-binding transcriptional LysR family regulator
MIEQGMNQFPYLNITVSMDVRFLVTFLEVVKTRHFTKTAENLYLTPSAVSARIKQLEEYFNAPLFIRHRHSIQLTAAGERLVPFAETLALTLNDAVKAMHSIDVQHIAIAGTPNAWELYLNQAVDHITQRFPMLSVRADILSNEQLSRQLHERTLDLAIVSEPFKSEHIEMRPLHNVEMLVCWANGAVNNTFADAREASAKYINVEWAGAKIKESLDKHFPRCRDAKFNTGSVRIALDYLLNHGGMAVLPESLTRPYIETKQVNLARELEPTTNQLWLAYIKDVKHSGLAEIIGFLLEQETLVSEPQ